jgi:hypothetical protein
MRFFPLREPSSSFYVQKILPAFFANGVNIITNNVELSTLFWQQQHSDGPVPRRTSHDKSSGLPICTTAGRPQGDA